MGRFKSGKTMDELYRKKDPEYFRARLGELKKHQDYLSSEDSKNNHSEEQFAKSLKNPSNEWAQQGIEIIKSDPSLLECLELARKHALLDDQRKPVQYQNDYYTFKYHPPKEKK